VRVKRLRVPCSDLYVIGINDGGVERKLFQIIPGNDGSLYASFPYTPFDRGRVGTITLPANYDESEGVVIGDEFPFTSHNVKYSHHPDGAVHFSQTGRVRSVIRKTGVPFGSISGHIFSVVFQGIERFERLDRAKKTRNRHTHVFSAPVGVGDAYKFVAHVHSERELAQRTVGSEGGPFIKTIDARGRLAWAVVLVTKFVSDKSRKFILLKLERAERMRSDQDEFMMFIGGFDPPEIALDLSKDTRALMFFYPDNECSPEIIHKLGTIDLHP
jgi:hypothetical protein